MTAKPTYFWCHECKKWTEVADSTSFFWCSRCSTHYQCDCCGSPIRRDGACSDPNCEEWAS